MDSRRALIARYSMHCAGARLHAVSQAAALSGLDCHGVECLAATGLRTIIAAAMSIPRDVGQPLRDFVMRRVGVLVAGIFVMVSVSFFWFALLPLADQIASDQFDLTATRVEASLGQVFRPPEQLLVMGQGWLDGQAPSLESSQAFNAIFKPVLRASPHLTSVVAGTDSGQGWLLLQLGDNRWRNRTTDVARWGSQRQWLAEHVGDSAPQPRWVEQQYDPRQRPWYLGALALPSDGTVFWSAPYTFFTTGDPGITASMRMRLHDGHTLVLGLDLTLRDISQTTMRASVGQRGLALVMTDDERVLALPRSPAAIAEPMWLKQVLKPVAELGLPELNAALARWRQSGHTATPVLSLLHNNTRWLVSTRPYALGQQRLWVMVLAPAADFSPAWASMLLMVSLALLCGVLLAMWIAYSGTRRLTRPLEKLAHNSQRIGQLDFDSGEQVHSRVAEIGQLADSQQTMAALLRDNQDKLDAQAEELQCQVDALKLTEARLQQQNDQLATIIENFPGAVSVVDADLRLVAFNAMFGAVFALPQALLNRPDLMYEDVIRYNAERGDYGLGDTDEQVRERVALARQFLPHRFERTLPNGTVLDIRGTPLPQGGFVTLYVDITESKRHEHELEHLAHFDALTSLPNRVLMADRLRQAMPLVQRRGLKLAVLFLDLDGFKTVNDVHGHAVGDALLLTLAGRMKQVLRDGDTLSRLGGDEFVAVLMDIDSIDASVPILERLLQAVAAPFPVNNGAVSVSASIGVTLYPQTQDVEADQLLRQADQAMYVAKQAGKNRYHLFDAAQDMQMRSQFEGVQRLQQAYENQEFVLYYQPKVNMRSAAVVGAEALIRWQHPQRGVLAPAEFLPLIEDHPLMVDLGRWVINTALQQMSDWQAQGLHLPVSINVGARQLQEANFVHDLRAALAAHPDVAAGDVQIEVLETSALQDMARVDAIMVQCAALGVSFALDDFGTGYSSLTYLRRLPATALKIDQSFVRDMLDDADDLSILLGVLDLANSFHREVIAEGVETVDHGHMLLQLGCELAQGYGIARPMPAPDIPAWAAAWRGHSAWHDVAVLPRQDLPLLFAIVEHRAWVVALESYLLGEKVNLPQLEANKCRVGQWLDGGGLRRRQAHPGAQQLVVLHQRIHELAAHLCELKAQGQSQALYMQMPPLSELRDALLAQLQSLLGEPDA